MSFKQMREKAKQSPAYWQSRWETEKECHEQTKKELAALREQVKHIRRGGFNHCFINAIGALKYLSSNPRPAGGQEIYNAEHLHQIANEISKSLYDLPTPPGEEG